MKENYPRAYFVKIRVDKFSLKHKKWRDETHQLHACLGVQKRDKKKERQKRKEHRINERKERKKEKERNEKEM